MLSLNIYAPTIRPRINGGRVLNLVLFLIALLVGSGWASPANQPRRVANYGIDARLDPETRTVEADQIVVWRNTTPYPTRELFFHLYLNAFRDLKSSFALEAGGLWQYRRSIPDHFWGSIEVTQIEVEEQREVGSRAVESTEFVQPDDNNPNDRTVLRVLLDSEVEPGDEIRLRLSFRSKLPRGIARTGWVDDYFFGAQWFPKLGVFKDGAWNCHQYHAVTEYFSNFGDYRVQLTVPAAYTVGGTGPSGRLKNPDGSVTHTFLQEGVHDFAWVASTRLRIHSFRFVESGLPSVGVRLLLLPEHEHLKNRYVKAIREALKYYGRWFGPYPYEQLTVVDPAPNSHSDGMEYPTFVTGRAHFLSPPEVLTPEAVTVHEVGHQWWYAVVANNEFEEAWLDEGLTSYTESRVLKQAYPEPSHMERYFGGIPLVYDCLRIPFETLNLPPVRRNGTLEVMTRPSWTTLNGASYSVNAYAKPEVTLWTFERMFGEDLVLGALREYYQRFSFAHPTTQDLITVFNEVAGRDLSWFFEETFWSSELVDYSVSGVRSEPVPDSGTDALYRNVVTLRREEGARLPVEALVVFEDGEEVRESWDGLDRWHRLVYMRPTRVSRVVVDPERKLLLDVNPVNNSWTRREPGFSQATYKWGLKWLFWVQNLLETAAFLG